MSTLLAATPNLQHLVWQFSYSLYRQHATSGPVLDLNQLVESLSAVASTLVSLSLDAAWAFYGRPPGDAVPHQRQVKLSGTLRGLAKLSKLRRLTIAELFVTDFDPDFESVLGPSLESLIFTRRGDNLFYIYDLRTEEGNEAYDSSFENFSQWLHTWRSNKPMPQHVTFRGLDAAFRDWENYAVMEDMELEQGVRIEVPCMLNMRDWKNHKWAVAEG